MHSVRSSRPQWRGQAGQQTPPERTRAPSPAQLVYRTANRKPRSRNSRIERRASKAIVMRRTLLWQLEGKTETKKKERKKETERETGVPCNCSKTKVWLKIRGRGRGKKHKAMMIPHPRSRHAESVKFHHIHRDPSPPFWSSPWWSDPQRAQTPLRAPGSVGGQLEFRLGENCSI